MTVNGVVLLSVLISKFKLSTYLVLFLILRSISPMMSWMGEFERREQRKEIQFIFLEKYKT